MRGPSHRPGLASRLVDRTFRREDMTGDGVCPVYLTRWTLARGRRWAVYLHHFVRSDWSQDLHDHPKAFMSIGLRGGYTEHTPTGSREWRAPWVRRFPAVHRHTLEVAEGAWTIAVVGSTVRAWGFWMGGTWIPWKIYVDRFASARKACR